MVSRYMPMAVSVAMRTRSRARPLCSGLAVLSLLVVSNANAQISDFNTQDLSVSIPGMTFGIPRTDPSVHGLQLVADTGVAESDNITLARSDADKISQTVSITDVDLAFQEETRRLAAILKGDFSYLDYLEHAYGSQLVGRFDGFASYSFVPERFWWVIEDNFGQAQLDPFTPVTPLNHQNINYVTTGPRWTSYLTSTNFLQVEATASRTQYAVSPFDSTDFFGGVTFGHRQTADSTLALVANTEESRFDNTVVNTNFERDSLYVRYEIVGGSRSDLTADLGATAVRSGSTTRSDPLARLSLMRKL